MKLSIFPSLFILFSLLLACSDDNGACVTSSGSIITDNRTLDSYNSIELQGIGNVHVSPSGNQLVRIQTYESIVPLIKTEVVDQVLVISVEESTCINSLDSLEILLSTSTLESITLTGAGNIAAEGYNHENLTVNLSGAGNVSLKGTAEELTASLTGAGNLNAFDLTADVCTVSVAGVGYAEVTVAKKLNATITGVGSILYKGNPSITSNITGVGRLIDAN